MLFRKPRVALIALILLATSLGAHGKDHSVTGGEPPPPPGAAAAQLADLLAKKMTPEEAIAAYTDLAPKVADPDEPFIGNSETLRRVEEVLTQPDRRVAFLTGMRGAGKSYSIDAIAPGYKGNIFKLNLTKFQAGLKFDGDQAERFELLLEYFKAHPDDVLFVDEAHMFFTQKDFAERLKEALANGQLNALFGTTEDEFAQDIEPNRPLKDRGPRISYPPVTEVDMLVALRARRVKLSRDLGVDISDGALERLVKLTIRSYPSDYGYRLTQSLLKRLMAREKLNREKGHFSNLSLKDSIVRMEHEVRSREMDLKLYPEGHSRYPEIVQKLEDSRAVLKTLENEQTNVAKKENVLAAYQAKLAELAQAKKIGNLERVGELTYGDELKNLKDEAERLEIELELDSSKFIEEGHVDRFIAQETGFKLAYLQMTDKQWEEYLAAHLKSVVIGQDDVVNLIADADATARANVSPKSGPRNVYLLLGPPGVGKDTIVEQYTMAKYGSLSKLTKVEWNTLGVHSDMEMNGSGPGLINNKQGGKLEEVRRDPHRVLFIDEWDKNRHQDSKLYFLSSGKTKDAMGRDIDVTNTDVFLAGNFLEEYVLQKDDNGKNTWSREMIERYCHVDPGAYDNIPDSRLDAVVIRRQLMLAGISPSMIDRVPIRVLLNKMTLEKAAKVAHNELEKSKKHIKMEYGVTINFDASVDMAIARQAFAPGEGARGVISAREASVSRLLKDLKTSQPGGRFNRGDEFTVKFVPSANGHAVEGGKLVVEQNGQVLDMSRDVFYQMVEKSPEAAAAGEIGEAGHPKDPADVHDVVDHAEERARH